MEKEFITIRVRTSTRPKLKLLAARVGLTMTDILDKLVDQAIAEQDRKEQADGIRPTQSSADRD